MLGLAWLGGLTDVAHVFGQNARSARVRDPSFAMLGTALCEASFFNREKRLTGSASSALLSSSSLAFGVQEKSMSARLIVFVLICFHSCVVRGEILFDWATVGDAGNAPSTNAPGAVGSGGEGSVDYEYRISKHEVTNEQYAEFLDAVALEDPHALFHPDMGSPERERAVNFATRRKLASRDTL